MLDLTMLAFELSFRYRNPVILAGDGYLGQITGRVELPEFMIEPGIPEWAVFGDEGHRRNLINSIRLDEADLERHNVHLIEKYELMAASEQRSDSYLCDDADWLVVASNTPARIAKGAIRELRDMGIRAGLFRPVTLWPFPIDALAHHLHHAKGILMVEAGAGQLEDELRLALSHSSIQMKIPIDHVQHYGGVLPQAREIVEKVISFEVSRNGKRILQTV
jgi:pyruvate/2-oxoacid:ferredoxin oxidoreductase alpha subunit